ncbi:hypothetical protein NCCP2716_14530 [Sporosarcina sp. NCCP-2716]|uniref:ATP-dependent nuclease n=1 Tax=Sporosarcina sp. NCCP-2716 TaxID=2943679 RepID=UPI00203ED940|nr:AAA family ATPase [Sporosarcina sp. NCCP-2716]GKV68955.1 hypothetical protein NCCP2716_14530 [Sporosarcina sp. NCCP-2716]
MYLSELSVWNFRKFSSTIEGDPGLILNFTPGLNLLVGENNSGKTAIIDAIKYTIHTQSYENIRIENEDFHLPAGETDETNRASELRIECVFKGFSNDEAKNFLEWLGMEKNDQGNYEYYLKVSLTAKRNKSTIYYDIKAGPDHEGKQLSGEARNLLRSTYLKPLRDAEKEMSPKRNSRLAQILNSHDAFKGKEEGHYIFEAIKEANEKIQRYFKGINQDGSPLPNQEGKKLLKEINDYLDEFGGINNKLQSNFTLAKLNLKNILERLNLEMTDNKSGLGSQNLLFIATELLLLKRNSYQGLKLALVEEIEAHLHVQAQIRLIDYLQEEVKNSDVQLIMTTHSTDLASKVRLENLIICKEDKAFPMGQNYTTLNKGDYLFLERFLDSMKANLFFAQGVILVEGDSENLLLPTIADIIGKPFSKHGVTVVNVGNTAFLRYSRIFKRKNPDRGVLNIPVAAITDNDIKPDFYKTREPEVSTKSDLEIEKPIEQRRADKISNIDGQNVRLFISPDWTLEYDLALGKLQKELLTAVLRAEKIGNSDVIGLTLEKKQKITKDVDELYEEWEKNSTSNEERAFYIYYDLVLKKKISKAITAQCFAEILEDLKGKNPESIKSKLQSDPQLQYIVQAIHHATTGGE